jgi:Flp pilus assembly protein TadB
MIVVIVACSVGIGVGTLGLLATMRARPTADRTTRRGERRSWSTRRFATRFGFPLVTAIGVGTITRWPVAGLMAAVAAVMLPSALRSTSSLDTTRRAEAVAVWTELLRDTLTASAGLGQAIVTTANLAPEAVRVPASHLADRIMSGVPVDTALRLFASEVDDPSADEVVSALRLATTHRAQRLVDLLGALADSTRDVVAMRLRVEASRASARSGVRLVLCFSIGFVALLSVVARSYLAPFGSVTGQLVLVVVGLCYGAGLMLMVRLVRYDAWRQPLSKGLPL